KGPRHVRCPRAGRRPGPSGRVLRRAESPRGRSHHARGGRAAAVVGVPTKAGLRYVCDVARARAHLASAAFAVLLVATLAPGCSRGEGSGCATGELNIPDCWAGPFN